MIARLDPRSVGVHSCWRLDVRWLHTQSGYGFKNRLVANAAEMSTDQD